MVLSISKDGTRRARLAAVTSVCRSPNVSRQGTRSSTAETGRKNSGSRRWILGAGYIFQLPRRKTTSDARLRVVIGGAASVVTDDCLRSTPRIDVQLHAVDSSCIVPMSRIPERSYAAYSIRPKIHRLLPEFLRPVPAVEMRVPCRETFGDLHTEVTAANLALLVASCEIDHTIRPSTTFRGGRQAAEKTL